MHRRLSSRIASASSTRGLARAAQRVGRQQARQAVVEFVLGVHAARGIEPRQQGMHAGLFERPGAARRDVAGNDLHHSASSTARRVRALEQGPGPARQAALLHAEAPRAAVAAQRERHVGARGAGGQQLGHGAGVDARCQAAVQAAAVVAQGGGARRRIGDRGPACRRHGIAGRRPVPLSQKELIGGTPRAVRSSFTRSV